MSLSVRRATVFLGIGINAGGADPPISHILEGGFQVKVIPDELPLEKRRELAEEFARWVVANAFRELAESFAVFLTELYSGIYVLQNEPVKYAVHRRAVANFAREGVSRQLEIVSEMLDLPSTFAATFSSMNQARNCMAHRRGIVGVPDIDTDTGVFTMRWRAMAAVLDDGRDISSAFRGGEPVLIEEEQSLSMKMVDREKSFARGEQIRLDRHDLSEFCFAVQLAAEHVTRGMIAYATTLGKLPSADIDPVN